MTYKIESGKGVGQLTFGMKRDDVKELLGKPDHTTGTLDIYDETGMRLDYNKDDTLALVEFTGPETVFYEDEDLMKVADPAEWLEDKDESADVDPPNLISEELGISFYLPDPESDDRAVAAFEPGYYDKEEEV